jgi:hypothetical protein
MIDLKLWHCGSEFTVVRQKVDRIRKKLTSFMNRVAMSGGLEVRNFSK